MKILDKGRLNRNFLESAALQNVRAFLDAAKPTLGIRGRSLEALLEQIEDTDLEMSVEEFRTACWDLMSTRFRGNHHIALSTVGDLFSGGNQVDLGNIHRANQVVVQNQMEIETNSVLDTKITNTGDLQILFVGETEAEVADPSENKREVINGLDYEMKAYRILDVPVFSQVDIGPALPYVSITTRAIHQKVRPSREIDRIRNQIEAQLGSPIPPLGGVAEGIIALWGTHITPRRFESEEPDGTKVGLTRAPGKRNKSSEDVEDLVKSWEFKNGHLFFDDGRIQGSFSVDAGKAIFSFGTRVTRANADYVIQAILAAAP